MTGAEWATCTDPRRMLNYHRLKKDPRRLRLLAVACARLIPPPSAPPMFDAVLDAVERYADGVADRAEFLAVRKALRTASREKPAAHLGHALAAFGVLTHLTDDAMEGLTLAITMTRDLTGPEGAVAECDLIRCLLGHSDRRPSPDPGWLTSAVVTLARGIYDDRAFDRLPVLADALEDAGCADASVLTHCRGGGPHARGCWVVDGLLGR